MQLPCLPSCNYGNGSVSWTVNVCYTADFFEPYLGKYSILEATKQIFVQRNDSCIQKLKNDNYHHRQLIEPVSQIDALRIMLGFLVEGHIYTQSVFKALITTIVATITLKFTLIDTDLYKNLVSINPDNFRDTYMDHLIGKVHIQGENLVYFNASKIF